MACPPDMRVLFIVACQHGLKAVAGEQGQNIRPRHVIGTVLRVADFIRRNGTWSGSGEIRPRSPPADGLKIVTGWFVLGRSVFPVRPAFTLTRNSPPPITSI